MSTQRKSNSSSHTWLHTGHAFTNRFHHAPSFMPKNTWKEALRVSPTESICISVAHSCCYNLKTTKSFQIGWPTIFTIGPHTLASSNTPYNGGRSEAVLEAAACVPSLGPRPAWEERRSRLL